MKGVFLTAFELSELRAAISQALDVSAADSGALTPLGDALRLLGRAEQLAERERAGAINAAVARLRGRARLMPVPK